jgi:uncharacterized protein (TIGR01319 family)
MSDPEVLLITDIGSTTTKGILLKKENNRYALRGIAKTGTTVEHPYADVKIGLYRVIRALETKEKVSLLTPDSEETNFSLAANVGYLTTSSAGGGLQILVVGLALNESASSAERAAYGAGGVILDTIAVDDRRLPVERIQLIDLLRPDIILFSGGVDGGAYASVIRMGELLKAAKPQPKFGVSSRVPLIYAGNIEAREFIGLMFGEQYDLHIVDNIRPKMDEENLEPARDEIHRLFMENVMEQAPGYSELKGMILDKIIPTPTGVINSLAVLSKHLQKQIIAVDIGGATTDIFSNIFGSYYRTVSANFGMSYSISNVLAEAGFANIKRWLPAELDENYIRNYIFNKMLYPTFVPSDDYQEAIEQAAAREAIRMSRIHHLQMNFQIQRLGFLERVIRGDNCRFKEAMYFEQSLSKRKFSLQDFNIVLGAGGIFSGAKNRNQAVSVLSDSFDIEGITEIWYDPEFLSPHLGKLSEVAYPDAEELLLKSGYEKLAVTVKPLFKLKKKPRKLMTIMLQEEGRKETFEIFPESLKIIKAQKEAEFTITCLSGCTLGENYNPVVIRSNVPLLIDTRSSNLYDFNLANEILQLYDLEKEKTDIKTSFGSFMEKKQIFEGCTVLQRKLPYKGDIYVKEGDLVEAETLLGETKYEPPMLFVISILTRCNIDLDSFPKGLLVAEGDEIKAGQKVFHLPAKSILESNIEYHSVTRGIVEKINYDSGSLYLREIQDYPLKSLKINIAEKMGIPPKELKTALKKRENDFVRTGETLAKSLYKKNLHDLARKESVLFSSPTTGNITDIDYEQGTITIQYLKIPFRLSVGVKGKVLKTEDNRTVDIECSGTMIDGIIGFGSENFGFLAFLEEQEKTDLSLFLNKILAVPFPVGLDFLKRAEKAKIKGLIIPSLNNGELVGFLGKEVGIALTGKEPIPYPVIITEGCGEIPMHPSIAGKLKEAEGREVFLDTFTQIRAGVKRPKIIISG